MIFGGARGNSENIRSFSDSRFESSASHSAIVLVSKLYIYKRQHRKINSFARSKEDEVKEPISHTSASSNDSLLKSILSYAAILREAPDWTVVMT